MKIELEFTKDYANFKRGDRKVFSHQLGHELIKLDVAQKVGEQVTRRTIEPVQPPKNKVEKPAQTKEVQPPKKKGK